MFANGRKHPRRAGSRPVLYDPTEWPAASSYKIRQWSRRVGATRGIVILVLIGLVLWVYGGSWIPLRESKPKEPVDTRPKPPLFEKWQEAELALPQHFVDDPFAGGKKYLWVECHVAWVGWGNQAQDLIMNAHLAYMTGRSFVFDNFTWSRGNAGGLDEFNGRLIPAEIPTTALISGPVVGGPFPKNDSMLRAIKKTYWHQICPEPYKVRKEDINPTMPDQPTALTMLNTWIDVINKIDNPCVQIDGYDSRVFDMYVYGDPRRYVDIWPSLRQSPVVQYWGYSPLIHEAYEANKALISGRPTPLSEPYYFCNSPQAGANGEVHAGPYRCSDPYAPLPGLLALHIRRGDFENHCRHLANWSSEWNGINLLPELPDRFVIPDGSGGGQATPSAMAHYLKRCYPDMKQIVEKLDDVRRSEAGKGLSEVYVMTNGKLEWANELKAAIMKMGGWNKVVSSRDLVLTREQREVGQAVDMMIGERAQVVIGNGWSSLTSGIVMMRLARGHSLESNRFW